MALVSRKRVKELLWRTKPANYFADCLKIEHKQSGKLEPLELNSHQQKIQAVIDDERAKGKPVRVLILKPRQTGISTISSANLFHSVRLNGGTAMVVSKDLDSSEHIFGIIQRFHRNLPNGERQNLKAIASNRKELKFEPPNGGRILVETAGKSSAGHSFTIRNLLLSEVSRWPEGCEDSLVGLFNAVPSEPDTTVIIESVANGMQGWFYESWHRHDLDYVKIFLPWYEHSEYSRELPIDRTLYEAKLEPEERRLMADYALTLEQLEWRRWSIRNNCQSSPEKFKEQYPATAREAFISSGNAFFHLPTVDAIKTSQPLRCDLRVDTTHSGEKEIRVAPNPNGYLRLWKRPQDNHRYVMGADIAEGIEIDGAPADDRHDYSSADILDANTGEQVAQLHGKLTPDEFGRQLALVGKWYNYAFTGIETNAGYGHHALSEMTREGYPEYCFYRRQVMDEGTRRPTRKLGWQTTRSNRRELMSRLDMAIRNSELFISSEETVTELRSFVVKPDGRIEGGSGQKDDRVFSLAIAYECLGQAPAKAGVMSEPADVEYHPATYKPYRGIYRRRSLVN